MYGIFTGLGRVVIKLIDSITGEPVDILSTGGAAHVLNGTSGTLQVFILDSLNSNAPDANANRINNATGYKAFRVTPLTPAAVAGVTAIVYGWSTTANDITAVNVVMASLVTDITTPSGGGVAKENVGAIYPINAASGTQNRFTTAPWIICDGTNTFKTIAVRCSGGAYTKGVMVEVIV